MTAYSIEAGALDRSLLALIADWSDHHTALDDAAFEAHALELATFQLRWNKPYAAFAARRGISTAHPPRRWSEIPAVPVAAFRDVELTTFDAAQATLEFHTSGTTADHSGRHYLERVELYEAALLAGFDRWLLADGARLRYLNLVPDVRIQPHSSLGYMMSVIAGARGDGADTWYVDGAQLALDRFEADLMRAIGDQAPVCIATTAFALADVCAAFAARGRRFALPPNSRVMETGGFKGRTRAVSRAELYAQAGATFGVPRHAIVAEYGMTELSSQYYDAHDGRAALDRAKHAPPWLRTIVVDADGAPAAPGVVGILRHVDLANRGSVIALETEDLGALTADGLHLLGREQGAHLRGCSLDAEMLAGASGR